MSVTTVEEKTYMNDRFSTSSNGIVLSESQLDVPVDEDIAELTSRIQDAPVILGLHNSPNNRLTLVDGRPVIVVTEDASPPSVSDSLNQDYSDVSINHWDRALSLYRQQLSRNSNDQQALLGLIYAHERRGLRADMAALDRMAVDMPNIAVLQAARARLLMRYQDYFLALRAFHGRVESKGIHKGMKM